MINTAKEAHANLKRALGDGCTDTINVALSSVLNATKIVEAFSLSN